MFNEVNLPVILIAALVASASPGPATLAIAGTAMRDGRRKGLAMATGVTTGSWAWSISAALGLSAIMLSHAWTFEVIRYLGAGYLLYLAYKSAKSALRNQSALALSPIENRSIKQFYLYGLGLHLTNPKAILFFGALFSMGIPSSASISSLILVIVSVGLQSAIVFGGYALLFSNSSMILRYQSMRRWFEGFFALVFGVVGLKVLLSKVQH